VFAVHEYSIVAADKRILDVLVGQNHYTKQKLSCLAVAEMHIRHELQSRRETSNLVLQGGVG